MDKTDEDDDYEIAIARGYGEEQGFDLECSHSWKDEPLGNENKYEYEENEEHDPDSCQEEPDEPDTCENFEDEYSEEGNEVEYDDGKSMMNENDDDNFYLDVQTMKKLSMSHKEKMNIQTMGNKKKMM